MNLKVMRGIDILSRSSSSRPKSHAIRGFILALAAALMASRSRFCFTASSEVGPEPHVEDTGPVKVYIYNDPVFDETAVIKCYREHSNGVAPWLDEREGKAQDTGEIWLHQSLLSHPWRVLDPEDADVFFIPIYPVLNAKVQKNNEKLKECDGLGKQQRATRSIMHLVKNSPYFNRFGGADHVVVCAWWNCGRGALDRQHRMLLRRAVIGINEKLDHWSMWGCGERMVTVPYTPSSAVTTMSVVGGRSTEERDIPFFFVGTSRGRPERENLQVVMKLSPDSVVAVGNNMHRWSQGGGEYAEHISRSRFCFCPRGDTISSRRIFDAVAAGCIPVITTEEVEALPFIRAGLNYSEFAVVADYGSFRSTGRVEDIVMDLSSRSDEQLQSLREGLVRGRASLTYGKTKGGTLADMEPFHDTASRFLQEVHILLDNGGLWNCPSSHITERMLAPRTLTEFPPNENERSQWLHESETIVIVEQSLLFCAPPNTGSMQFRMLAKRMKGVDHWSESNVQSLLFDAVDSKLPLLDLTNKRLLEAIYRENGSGWIKIGVVRDPVTRLLSAYLDLVRTWPSRWKKSSHDDGSPPAHRGLWADDGWEWFDTTTRHRRLAGGDGEQAQPHQGEHQTPLMWGDGREGVSPDSRNGSRLLQDAAVPPVPTFKEVLNMLENHLMAAPSAFRPASSLCGMGLSPFDTIIPFETLQKTSRKVLQSLPSDIWRDFGESGWGPHGTHAFMEFDYGTVARHHPYADQDIDGNQAVGGEKNEDASGRPTSPTVSFGSGHVFSDGSCTWTEFYTDQTILEKVGGLYSQDFDLFGWYDLHAWKERLEACLK